MNTQRSISDPDVRLLVCIAETLRADYEKDDDRLWEDSPFGWIKTRPSRQVGKIGEQLVAGWCAAKGLDVTRCPDSEADRIVEGRRVEIKFSMLWKSAAYTFQQFRDQDYEYAICLGVSPFAAHCWVIPKQVVMAHARAQHDAGGGGSDTRWIQGLDPLAPGDWLAQWGGTLGEAFEVLKSFGAEA